MHRSDVMVGLIAVIAGMALGGSAPAAASGAGQETELVLAGTWVLNEALSDETPGRDGGRRGRGGLGPGRERMARAREAMREAMAASRRVMISGDRSEVLLTLEDGNVVRHIPDGREHASPAGSPAGATRTARWNGETLEVDIKLPTRRNVTMHRTFELQDGADDSRQLVVTSRVEGGRGGDREVRRVYDEAEP